MKHSIIIDGLHLYINENKLPAKGKLVLKKSKLDFAKETIDELNKYFAKHDIPIILSHLNDLMVFTD